MSAELEDIHEECGIFGVWGHSDAARLTYFGLHALQHRGQEGAGIVSNDNGHLIGHRGTGLLTQVFSDEREIERLKGDKAIGHVRYATAGSGGTDNIQPFIFRFHDGDMALCHNGNLTNCPSLRRKLEDEGAIFHSNSDTEVLMHLIRRSSKPTFMDKLKEALNTVHGGFAYLIMTENAMIGALDPNGFRPLSLGKMKNGAYVLASETCALDIVGAEYVRDVRPGEILRINAEGLVSEQGVPAAEEPANCIFEQVYFARPDSIMNGKSVYACRYDMGRQLAHEEPVEADLVIGVPDSGLPPAEGYSHESGIPFGEGLIKNRYVGRTFIEPTQELRAMGVRMKLNPLRDNIEGKRLVVIDDSIVRGTTMVQLVKMLRNAGAKEIHIRINSPEVIWPCFYGIDTDVQSQLISANKTVDEICEYIGADSLAFLSVEGLLKVMPKGGYCDACFTGRYPVAIPESFGRDKFMEGFKPRNLDKPLHFDDDAVVEKYDDRSWEEEHGEA